MLIAIHKCPCEDPDCTARQMIAYGKDRSELEQSIVQHWSNMELDNPLVAELEVFSLVGTETFTLSIHSSRGMVQ